jgi:hypothetical protein
VSTAHRWRAAPLLLVVLLALLTGTIVPTAGAAGLDLPPADLTALKKELNPIVRPLGLRVTRGMLQNLETYETDPQGTHLALYVEPVDPGYTNAQYLRNFTRLTRALVPLVFQRWKGLETFDVCQEPVGNPAEVPPPRTQIFVARTALDRVGSWKKASLTDLLVASPRSRNVSAGYYVYFDPTLRNEPAFVRAATKAGWTTGTTAFGH